MPLGKRKRGVPVGLQAPLRTVSPLCELNYDNRYFNSDVSVLSSSSSSTKCGLPNVVVAAVWSQGAVIKGVLGNMCVDVMMDSGGSSISLIMESFAKNYNHQPPTDLNLISAAGEPIPVIGQVVARISVGNLLVDHNFIVVHSLITPVILG